MNIIIRSAFIVCVCLILAVFLVDQTQASPVAWYDAERQAIAVNLYSIGPVGTVYLDFDSDHTWGGIIDQWPSYTPYEVRTYFGVFHSTSTCFPGGWCDYGMLFGWGDSLGSANPVDNFSTAVTEIDIGQAATDKFLYFVDHWDPSAGNTTVYVRPLGADNVSIPVVPGDLDHIYVTDDPSGPWEWHSLTSTFPPPTVTAYVHISPKTLNLENRGQWLTMRIELPKGYSAEAVDTSRLTIWFLIGTTNVTLSGPARQSWARTIGPKEVSYDGGLLLKFERAEVDSFLHTGYARITVYGYLSDGTRFTGRDEINIAD